MIATLHKWLAKADAMSEKRLLGINLGLACFVVLAHGGALAITYAKPAPEAEGIRQLATISLPIAALVIVSAAVSFIRIDLRRSVLSLHGIVFAGSAVVMILWALGILVNGIPKGNFSWSVGFLSFWVAYSVFVLCRFTLPSHLRSHPAVFYAPVTALLGAAVIDIGVFLRLASDFGAKFGS
jgi:hypothetical protein